MNIAKKLSKTLLISLLLLSGSIVTGQNQPAGQSYPYLRDSGRTAVSATTPARELAPAAPVESRRVADKPVEAGPVASSAANTSGPGSELPGNVVFDSNLYRVTKEAVSGSQVGGEFAYRLRVDAKENIYNIEVFESVPDGVRFIRANPEQQKRDGGSLYWAFPEMAAGTSRSFDITVSPEAEGIFKTCSVVTIDPMLCLPMYAGMPQLEIVKTGSAQVELSQVAVFQVAVTNNGTAPARNVKIVDTLPRGLRATGSLEETVPVLLPGETHMFRVTAQPTAKGEFVNTARATFDGGEPVTATAVVNVVESKVELIKAGPERAYVFNTTPYEITVRNTGDTTLESLVITDKLPDGVELVDAGTGIQRGREIVWNLPSLAAGTERKFNLSYRVAEPTTLTNSAEVVTARGLTGKDDVRTRFIAAPGLKSAMVDSEDPIRVGGSVTYEIELTNQGRFDGVPVEVTVTLPEELQYVSSKAPGEPTVEPIAGTNSVRLVFGTNEIEPRRSLKIEVTARAVKSGIARVRLEYLPGYLEEPLIEEESTFIY